MGFYSDLLVRTGPWVTFERCVERAFAAVAGEMAEEIGGPLEAATIYEGHRGLPKIFGGWSTNGEAPEFAEVVARSSQILLVATGREDMEGEEVCELAVVVATTVLDGDPEAQLELHEQRVAAMRGMMSDGACQEGGVDGMLARVNAAQRAVVIAGWARKPGPAEMEYAGQRWIATERYVVRGYRSGVENES